MTTFIPTSAFEGSKDGMVFKLGDEGLGYYTASPALLDDPVASAAAAEMVETPREFAPGLRVCDEDGCPGTVRYVGPVRSAKNSSATYIGVEWDDPARGKVAF